MGSQSLSFFIEIDLVVLSQIDNIKVMFFPLK